MTNLWSRSHNHVLSKRSVAEIADVEIVEFLRLAKRMLQHENTPVLSLWENARAVHGYGALVSTLLSRNFSFYSEIKPKILMKSKFQNLALMGDARFLHKTRSRHSQAEAGKAANIRAYYCSLPRFGL